MKKFLMGIAAALALSFAMPQNADAKRSRYFIPWSEGEYIQVVIDDAIGYVEVAFVDENGEYM